MDKKSAEGILIVTDEANLKSDGEILKKNKSNAFKTQLDSQ